MTTRSTRTARGRRGTAASKWPASLTIGVAIVAVVAVLSVCAPLIAPVGPNVQDLSNILAAPSGAHWFGTDALGRDTLSRVLYGGQFEVLVILPAVAIALAIALPIGMSAGYLAGWVDRIVTSVSDTVLTFPSLVLAIVLVALMGSGTWPLVITIIVTQTPQMIRYVRGFTHQLSSAQFILAARSSGSSTGAILLWHVARNIGGRVLVIGSLFASEGILVVAALGFLGIGVQPPNAEWGTMLSDGRADFMTNPQVMLFPGAAIALLILGLNLAGDGLRDYLDRRN